LSQKLYTFFDKSAFRNDLVDTAIYLDFTNNSDKMSINRKCPLFSGHLDTVDI